MKRTGLALIELLVAISIGLAVMGGAFLTLRQAARSLSTEQKIVLSQDQAARVLQGLSGELKDRPAAFLLPGASEQGAGLVALVGNGWPVILNGYSSQKIRITGGTPDLQVGAPAVLVSPSGEVFYINTLTSITPIDATAGVYELDFGDNCGNPLSFVQGMRVYKADTLTIAKTPGGLQIEGVGLENQQVIALKDFTLRYVYSSPERETLSQTYQGASLPDGSRLAALAFQATGTTEASRTYTARIPLKSGTVEVRNVVTCGGTSTLPPGTGVVTIIVNPAPPLVGGDVTLLASGYTRTTRQSYTFRDVPVGNVEVQSRDVWTDNLTAWAPNPRSQSGTLYAFAPLGFTISYNIVPSNLTFSATGFPSDGSATVSAGSYSVTLRGESSQTVSADPGVYRTSASREVSVSRSQGSVSWTEIYTLQSVSPDEVTVRSYGSASVTATYTGPLPGTLCYDGDCQQAAPGRYTAPAEQVVNTWTNTYTRPCPQGQTGSVTVSEQWRTVKYWTPSEGGLSSSGTLRFTSATRDERVDYREDSNCTTPPPDRERPSGNLTLTAVLATPLRWGNPDPNVEARGPTTITKTTWGSSTYEVPVGTYTVSARLIRGRFTVLNRSFTAEYTPSISQVSVHVPREGTGSSTVTYTAVNGTFCDFIGCRSVWPGVYNGTGAIAFGMSTYSRTRRGTYWVITESHERNRTYVHYFNPPYAVSSGETVRAPYTTYTGLVGQRFVVKYEHVSTGETVTVTDSEFIADYEYKEGMRCWALTYYRYVDHVTGDTHEQHPNTCVD